MVFDKDRLREAMGEMSVVELADKLGCPKSSISMYLSGQREPSKMAAQLIALNLGVNPAWLAGLDVPKYSNVKIISKTEIPATGGGGLEERIDLSQLSEDQRVSIQELQKLNPHFQSLARGLIESLLSSQQAGDNK